MWAVGGHAILPTGHALLTNNAAVHLGGGVLLEEGPTVLTLSGTIIHGHQYKDHHPYKERAIRALAAALICNATSMAVTPPLHF